MSENSIIEIENIVKWITPIDPTTDLAGIPDNVYPFNGIDTDQWAVVVNETQIAWARDYGVICVIYAEALRVKREHAQRCPQDFVPFDGIAPTTEDDRVDDYAVGVTLSPRGTGRAL